MVGEAWSVIAGTGSQFTDYNNPRPVIKVGETNSQGVVEITDMLFATIGPGMCDTRFPSGGIDLSYQPLEQSLSNGMSSSPQGSRVEPACGTHISGQYLYLSDS